MSTPTVSKEEMNVPTHEQKMSAMASERASIKRENAENIAAVPSEETRVRPPRKRQRVEGKKVCQVCGSKARAHHFGVMTCETCKAFFRRNANKQNLRQCAFKGGCEISFHTRRFCSACRLKKCFEVGMCADLIMDDEEKKELLQKVNKNRSRKKTNSMDSSSVAGDGCPLDSVTAAGLDLPAIPAVTQVTSINGIAMNHSWAEPSSLSSGEHNTLSLLATVGSQLTSPAVLDEGLGSQNTYQAVVFAPSQVLSKETDMMMQTDASVAPTMHTLSNDASVDPTLRMLSKKTDVMMRLDPSVVPAPHALSRRETDSAVLADSSVSLHSHAPRKATRVPARTDGLLVPPCGIRPPTPPTPSPTAPHPPDSWLQQQHHHHQQNPSPSPSPVPPASTAAGTAPRVESPLPTPVESPLPPPSPSLVEQAQALTSFQHVSPDDLPSNPHMYWQLTSQERRMLSQLSSAYQDTLLSILESPPPRDFVRQDRVTAQTYLQECEREAHNAIAFAKRLQDFRQLHTDQQIALLKASTNQVLGIRSCALYVVEKNAWLTRYGYFTLEHVTRLFPNHPYKDLGARFSRGLKSIVKNDSRLYALLHCMVLFDPSDEHIIDRQAINGIRDKYMVLFRHYLQSLYSYAHSERYMTALQSFLVFYRGLCREAKPLIRRFIPNIPNKLLVELMDFE